MAPTQPASPAAAADDEAELKEQVFKGVCLSWFFAVVAHCLCLQSEALLFRDACKGNLARAARLGANSAAAAGVLGVIVNQFGGKLSDSLGRKAFYLLGPVVQILTGLAAYSNSENPLVLSFCKIFRVAATTFSGTVMGSAALRDVFPGQEYGIRATKASSIMGLAIMTGPLLEGEILKRSGPKTVCLALSGVGLCCLIANSTALPETLPPQKRKQIDIGSVVAAMNPFGFVRIYTEGSPLLKQLSTIAAMQTLIDGKNMSDLGMIWMREHLKLSVESIRNFVMSYGLLSTIAAGKLTPALLKNMSVWNFTTFTNALNLFSFTMRGAAESTLFFFGAVPFMLPGVNGASNAALVPLVNKEMVASGFGVGESTAWFNNLRVVMGAVATLLYGHCYAFCQKRGLHAGFAYILAGVVGAAIPQALLMAIPDKSTLEADPSKPK